MNYRKPFFVLLAGVLLLSAAPGRSQTFENPSIQGSSSFAVITDSRTARECRPQMTAYKQTLEAEGLPVYIVSHDWTTPEQVRDVLRKLYAENALEGCVFIGRRAHRHDHQGAAPHLGLQNGRTRPPAPRNLGSFGPLLRRFRFAVRPAGHSLAGTVSLLRNVARFAAVHLLRHLFGPHQGAESLRRSLQTDCPLPRESRGRTPRRDAFRPVRLLHGPRLLLQFAHRLAR